MIMTMMQASKGGKEMENFQPHPNFPTITSFEI